MGPAFPERNDPEHEELLCQVAHAEPLCHPLERLVQAVEVLVVGIGIRKPTEKNILVGRVRPEAYPDVEVEPALGPSGRPAVARGPGWEVLHQARAHLEVDGGKG